MDHNEPTLSRTCVTDNGGHRSDLPPPLQQE